MKISSRLLVLGAAIVVGAGASALVACDSVLGTNNLQIGVACGPGTADDGGTCIPAAVADPKAPSFGGATSLSPASATSLRVDWQPAASALVAETALVYSVFVATSPGTENFASPAGTVNGPATSFILNGLTTGTDYYVVVRAGDGLGHQDSNVVELHAKAVADTTPPTFAGVVNASPTAGGKVTLTWAPATDDLSGAAGLTYLVYDGEADPLDTTKPVAQVTAQTTIDVLVSKPLTPYRFMVRAQDAAGNIDQNTKEVVAISGSDTQAPDFGGCTGATGTASDTVHLTWNAGHDDVTPDALLAYDVYAFLTPGPHALLKAASATGTAQGATSLDLKGLASGTKYYFQCRARDLSGNVGGNPADTIAATLADTTAPAFAGLLAATTVTATSYEVALTWAAATDYQTSAQNIVYEVFTTQTAGAENYALPPALSVTGGATTANILARPGETTYFVVRAVDEAKNLSTTIKELSVTPKISYDWQIQPIFTKSCVTDCHALGQRNYNPILAAPVSYTFVISDGVVVPGSPSTSALYQELSCSTNPDAGANYCNNIPPSAVLPNGGVKMPMSSNNLPVSGTDIATIGSWITQGAPGPLTGVGKPPGY